MKTLLLGYSKLSKKRIIPFFIKNKIKFSVASISFKKKINGAYNQFGSYEKGINNSNAKIAYISLPNSKHYYWAKKALSKGYNVIVDKPICKNIKQLKNLIKLSTKKKKVITEATFFNYHNQFNKAVKFVNGINNIKYVNANFVIPLPKKNSLLMSKKLSGGSFMDMGPYAAAVPRLFCSGKLINMKSIIVKNKKGLIVSFSIFCKFKKTSYYGFFCFGGEYKSNLIFISKNKYVELNRVFSPPFDKKLTIIFKNKNKIRKIKLKKENVFENFLKKIKNSLNKKKYNDFYKIALDDAKFREKILLSN